MPSFVPSCLSIVISISILLYFFLYPFTTVLKKHCISPELSPDSASLKNSWTYIIKWSSDAVLQYRKKIEEKISKKGTDSVLHSSPRSKLSSRSQSSARRLRRRNSSSSRLGDRASLSLSPSRGSMGSSPTSSSIPTSPYSTPISVVVTRPRLYTIGLIPVYTAFSHFLKHRNVKKMYRAIHNILGPNPISVLMKMNLTSPTNIGKFSQLLALGLFSLSSSSAPSQEMLLSSSSNPQLAALQRFLLFKKHAELTKGLAQSSAALCPDNGSLSAFIRSSRNGTLNLLSSSASSSPLTSISTFSHRIVEAEEIEEDSIIGSLVDTATTLPTVVTNASIRPLYELSSHNSSELAAYLDSGLNSETRSEPSFSGSRGGVKPHSASPSAPEFLMDDPASVRIVGTSWNLVRQRLPFFLSSFQSSHLFLPLSEMLYPPALYDVIEQARASAPAPLCAIAIHPQNSFPSVSPFLQLFIRSMHVTMQTVMQKIVETSVSVVASPQRHPSFLALSPGAADPFTLVYTAFAPL